MNQHLFKKLTGPPPFQGIVSSPHRAEIDQRLFTLRDSSRAVHQWMVRDLGMTDVSYATVNRYRNARLKLNDGEEGDLRRYEVMRDLRYLSRVIKLGKGTLDAGLVVRPSEAMRAIELRAHLLATFPEASSRRENEIITEFEKFVNAVRDITTPEQRAKLLEMMNGSVANGARPDA